MRWQEKSRKKLTRKELSIAPSLHLEQHIRKNGKYNNLTINYLLVIALAMLYTDICSIQNHYLA